MRAGEQWTGGKMHWYDVSSFTSTLKLSVHVKILYILDWIKQHHKYSCSSAISTLEGRENKRRLQTLSTDNAWSNKNFLYYLTFRMRQHTSSEVNGYNFYKHLKNTKHREGNWRQDKKK